MVIYLIIHTLCAAVTTYLARHKFGYVSLDVLVINILGGPCSLLGFLMVQGSDVRLWEKPSESAPQQTELEMLRNELNDLSNRCATELALTEFNKGVISGLKRAQDLLDDL